ncbi:hypothetical protein [Streptomyces sp.]|uniref:hypothetical protein n=1 Tax=Streptomyces sp. TaxID=1931 RepID=UPI002F3E6A1A
MLLHIPLVIALAAITLFLGRKGALKPTHGLACGAFGFYLADTSFAGSIHAAGADLLSMIGHFGG